MKSIFLNREEKFEAIVIYCATLSLDETERILNNRFPIHPICRKYLRQLIYKVTTNGRMQDNSPPGHSSDPKEQLMRWDRSPTVYFLRL